MATTGHCLCGEVTWRYDGAPNWVAHCHCESCRRNCSAGIVTFVGVPRSAVRFTRETPKAYVSSPGVRRLFCGTCGAPVAYDAASYPDEIHLYAAQHDDPAALKPQAHVFYGEALPWMHMEDGLKKFEKGGGGQVE